MHTARSPSTIPTDAPRDAQDLILSGSQFSLSKRPSSASPGKYFSRSVSVSVASDSRGKRNTLSDASNGGSRSIKNLRRSNSTTQVNQQANISLSQEPSEDYLSLFDSSTDGRKKLASISRASPDRTTWNVLDDQPRAFPLHSSSHSIGGVDPSPCHNKREPGITLAATFTANNRSNKGAVGNSVTTILHNNYSEKPLTPKSSNQKPSFNNILKATANDEVSHESGSLTKSQKNFSSVSSTSNNRSPVSAQRGSPVLCRRREASEEEAERFIQQVNQAAVTIQRWYRYHAKRRYTNQAALKQILASKRKEWEERTEEDSYLEQLQKKDEDRKRIREEKAHLAHLAAIQPGQNFSERNEPDPRDVELQQQRAQQVVEMHLAARVELESPRQTGVVRRKKLPKICPTNRGPSSPSKNNPTSPTDIKSKNTETNLNVTSEVSELSFRAISPALSNNRGSQCSQDHEDRAQAEMFLEVQDPENDRKMIRKEKARLAGLAATQELQQRRTQRAGDAQHVAAVELINIRQSDVVERKKPPKISLVNKSPVSPSNNSPMSPTDAKAKNTDSNLNIAVELGELSTFRAVSPALSNCRGSQCSQEILQRSVSVEDPRQGSLSSRPQSKTTLTELLDSLKLLEEEPENLVEQKCSHKDKYSWIDEDDSNSLTTDNLERHGQMSHHPELPDCGALLSEAKLQSIMNFLDEMEKSEQERPRSVTSGSHREAVLSEEELVGVEQTSATAAEVTGTMMRIKLELEEKKRAVNKLQTALAQQRELTARHVNETKKELNRDLHLQKEHYEATIQRHLALIDQLFNDKQALSERCERLAAELKQVNQKYNKMIAQMQEQHEMVWQILGPLCEEIKKLKELMSASEKIRKEKWIDEKTKKIKEITVKGLEPEIQKLISRHKQELKKQRTLHEAELLQADDRAAQRYMRQCEELRQQLEKEKEEQCQRERELAKQRYDQQLQEEALSLQQQRRRLYKEVADEKERMTQLAERQRAELDDLRRQLEENSSLAGRALREELDKIREEQERRHQLEIKAMQERLDIEKQSWEENYKKKEEVWLLSRERQLKEDLRRERDKEIELAIWTLEEETNKDKEECERAADNRLKRLREKYEAELKELQHSERSAVEKQHEMRKQHIEMEAELLQLRALIRQREEENEDISRTRDKLVGERHSLAEVIRLEFAERLVMTEEENRKMKMEVSEVRAKLRIEVERVTKEKEEEVSELLKRVKAAVVKKEETVNSLKKQYEAALKRADHLEALWEQQRKQLLQK